MAGPVIRIEGVSSLVRTMKAAEVDIDDLKDVQADVADIAAKAIADEAPVRSGRLRSTIRGSRAARRATVSAGRTSVPYAGPIHWGWPARNIEPNEFGVRGLERAEPRIEETLLDGIGHILESIRGV